MSQSRVMSLAEVTSSTLVGYFVALATQVIVFPLYGIQFTVSQNLGIALIFTAVSIVRSYVFRRVFNYFARGNV